MIYQGDCAGIMSMFLDDKSVDCVVTSPPYWGLRDYGVTGQLGLESTPQAYVKNMVAVFAEIRRVLKDEGTVWLNLGDSYARDARKGQHKPGQSGMQNYIQGRAANMADLDSSGLKNKDLAGIPWRVAFALQAAGWYLRQDIIWHKTNPMPESVQDRCTKAHEYVFLLTKSEKYFFDVDAIKEPATYGWRGSEFHTGKTGEHQLGRASKKPRLGKIIGRGAQGYSAARGRDRDNSGGFPNPEGTRQKRSVWTVTAQPFKGAHFATFPPALIEPCILAGCPKGGVVLDPFFGAGTTGVVAKKHDRRWIGIELNPDYIRIAEERLGK